MHVCLLDGTVEHGSIADHCVADHLRSDSSRDAIEARRRIDDAALDVVVRDQLLVVAVGPLGALAHQLGQPVGPRGSSTVMSGNSASPWRASSS